MEGFESGELFADSGEFQRFARDVPHRERRAAARVAVELGQHDAGERQSFVEGARGVDRVLPEHGIDDEQGFDRIECCMQRADFVHHRRVDRQTARGVDEQHLVVMLAREVERGERDIDGALSGIRGEEVDARLRGHGLQLFDGCRTVDVGGDRQHFFLVIFAQQSREFADGRRLARALESRHEHHRRRLRGQIQSLVSATHERAQFVMHDADERLSGRERADDFLPERLFLDPGDEFLDHRQGDIGFEQRHTDFTHGVGNVVFGEAGLTAQGLDDL